MNGVSDHGRGRAENDVKKSHHGWGGAGLGCWSLNESARRWSLDSRRFVEFIRRALCHSQALVIRQRVFPSGIPKETVTSLPQGDPTWRLEFEYFLTAARAGVETNLAKDSRIHEAIERLARQAEAQ